MLMKPRFNLFVVLLLALCSCDKFPKYICSTQNVVPDSLKDKRAEFVIEATRAASYHMTGGDYEDPEDVLNGANNIFEKIYSVEVRGLYIIPCHACNGVFVPENELTPEQRKHYGCF